MSTCSMTRAHYREILSGIAASGYRFCTFADDGEPRSTHGHFYLRHDVDLDPFAALALARDENDAGARATYFFHPASPYYNLSSAPVREAILEIEHLGGDVQLHFDAGPYQDGPVEVLLPALRQQAEWLSAVLGGKEIRAVSFHRPVRALLGARLDGMISTYSESFFENMRYASDSGGQWWDGCVCGRLDQCENMQCLIHPIWWVVDGLTPTAKVRAFLKDVPRRFDGWLRNEIRTYRRDEMDTPSESTKGVKA